MLKLSLASLLSHFPVEPFCNFYSLSLSLSLIHSNTFCNCTFFHWARFWLLLLFFLSVSALLPQTSGGGRVFLSSFSNKSFCASPGQFPTSAFLPFSHSLSSRARELKRSFAWKQLWDSFPQSQGVLFARSLSLFSSFDRCRSNAKPLPHLLFIGSASGGSSSRSGAFPSIGKLLSFSIVKPLSASIIFSNISQHQESSLTNPLPKLYFENIYSPKLWRKYV